MICSILGRKRKASFDEDLKLSQRLATWPTAWYIARYVLENAWPMRLRLCAAAKYVREHLVHGGTVMNEDAPEDMLGPVNGMSDRRWYVTKTL